MKNIKFFSIAILLISVIIIVACTKDKELFFYDNSIVKEVESIEPDSLLKEKNSETPDENLPEDDSEEDPESEDTNSENEPKGNEDESVIEGNAEEGDEEEKTEPDEDNLEEPETSSEEEQDELSEEEKEKRERRQEEAFAEEEKRKQEEAEAAAIAEQKQLGEQQKLEEEKKKQAEADEQLREQEQQAAAERKKQEQQQQAEEEAAEQQRQQEEQAAAERKKQEEQQQAEEEAAEQQRQQEEQAAAERKKQEEQQQAEEEAAEQQRQQEEQAAAERRKQQEEAEALQRAEEEKRQQEAEAEQQRQQEEEQRRQEEAAEEQRRQEAEDQRRQEEYEAEQKRQKEAEEERLRLENRAYLTTKLETITTFPSSHPLNQNISGRPVDGNSDKILANIGLDVGLFADFGDGIWRGGRIGIPYVAVGADQPKVPITFRGNNIDDNYGHESDQGPFPIPLDAPKEADFYRDGHVIAVDVDNGILYELYNAEQKGDGWEASSAAVFNLNKEEYRTEGHTSADAAGLPIFPLLVRYDETQTGEIDHAIRFTLERSKIYEGYVHPARHLIAGGTAPDQLPLGGRLRLKIDYDISSFSATNQVILRAMKNYGIILSDVGPSMYLKGDPNDKWSTPDIRELKKIKVSDFEVVELGNIRGR